MRLVLTCLVTGLFGIAPVLAFDAATSDVLARMKIGKLIPIADAATLMQQSERWCYNQDGMACAWSDIYLDVTDAGATFEIGNAWNEEIDVFFTDQDTFEEGRYICETTIDWLPTLRATRRDDGTPLGGRALWALRSEMRGNNGAVDCFDYVLKGSDEDAETITLLQRKWADGVTDETTDVVVTLHFDAATARSLSYSL